MNRSTGTSWHVSVTGALLGLTSLSSCSDGDGKRGASGGSDGNSSAGKTGVGGSSLRPQAAGTGGQGGGQVVDPALQSFCDSVTATAVKKLDQCRGVPPEIARSMVADSCPAWTQAVAEGRMAFDETQAATCLADLGSSNCDADSGPASCDRVLWGQVPDGGTCSLLAERSFFSECQTGAACIGGADAYRGTCVKRALLGQSCGSNRRCVAGETCSAASQTCVLKGTANQACE